MMQDQQSEGRQERRDVAGNASIDLAPSHKPTFISPSTPLFDREKDYSYYKAIFGDRPMPFAFLDLDLLEQNIRQVVSLAKGKRVRLASKSLCSVAVIRRILEADPCFQGMMCNTAQEAAYLASQGFHDLLIGHPTWNEQDIAAVARAIATGAPITLMVDSTEHVRQLETVAARLGINLPYALKLIGHWTSQVSILVCGVRLCAPLSKHVQYLNASCIDACPARWIDGL
jgi:Alanine racemase, N-terminal domain